MASSRPRRNASVRVGHLEPADGSEQYSLDQVKTMKRGILLKNFTIYDEQRAVYSCRFLKCARDFQGKQLSSLTAHLLIHVRECTEKSVKNPRFYETLTFHAVPTTQQLNFHNFDEDGEKIEPRLPDPISPILSALGLRKRPAVNKQPVVRPSLERRISFCSSYSTWKKYCFKAQKCRIESVEMSLRERRHLPSPIVCRKAPVNTTHQHRRVSIFNPLTRESRPSVIQLSVSKPMPERARQLVFSHSTASIPTSTSILSHTLQTHPILSNISTDVPNSTQSLYSALSLQSKPDRLFMFDRCSVNIDEELDRLAKVSRPSVICSNPIAKQTSSYNQFETDKYILGAISKIFDDEKAKKAIKRKASKSIPKKLQPVNQDSIFTINDLTGGTRLKTRRYSDLFGMDFGSEKDHLDRAIRASLEQADVQTNNRRRPRKSNQDQLPMTEVTT